MPYVEDSLTLLAYSLSLAFNFTVKFNGPPSFGRVPSSISRASLLTLFSIMVFYSYALVSFIPPNSILTATHGRPLNDSMFVLPSLPFHLSNSNAVDWDLNPPSEQPTLRCLFDFSIYFGMAFKRSTGPGISFIHDSSGWSISLAHLRFLLHAYFHTTVGAHCPINSSVAHGFAVRWLLAPSSS